MNNHLASTREEEAVEKIVTPSKRMQKARKLAEVVLAETLKWEEDYAEARLAVHLSGRNDELMEHEIKSWEHHMDLLLQHLTEVMLAFLEAKQNPQREDLKTQVLKSDEVQEIIAKQYASKMEAAHDKSDYETIISVEDVLAYLTSDGEWLKKNKKVIRACSAVVFRARIFAEGAIQYFTKKGTSPRLLDLSRKLLKLAAEL